MGKASRAKQSNSRRERIAAQQAAARRAERRRKLFLASGSVAVVVAVIVALVVVKLTSSNGHPPAVSEGPTGAALTSVENKLTNVPSSVTDAVGAGSVVKSSVGAVNSQGAYLAPVSGTTLTSDGKPEMLYVGAEYCPFCGAERWAMISALSRFGTFSGLSTIHSSSTDAYANTPTWTFYGSTYTSKYLSFVPVETTRNYRVGNTKNTNANYVALQTPTTAEEALISKYDPGEDGEGGPIPFIDIGNKFVEVGNLNNYGPQVLAGKTWTEIANGLTDPSNTITQGILGSANYLTASICKLTSNQPATACTPTITALESKL